MSEIIDATFGAQLSVKGLMTTRLGGFSREVYGSQGGSQGLNLGAYCGDDPDTVDRNRALLQTTFGRPITWMRQVHGVHVQRVSAQTISDCDAMPLVADAMITTSTEQALGVLSADCLPVLFASDTVVGVAHAGWRGLSAGVLGKTVSAMRETGASPSDVHVWLGAAIGPDAFEVGADVIDAFANTPESAKYFVARAGRPGKWLCDLYGLARAQLEEIGVGSVSGGGLCTVTDSTRFFSYRRDGQCGRMASVIALNPE